MILYSMVFKLNTTVGQSFLSSKKGTFLKFLEATISERKGSDHYLPAAVKYGRRISSLYTATPCDLLKGTVA
jgi:hypothetical protein